MNTTKALKIALFTAFLICLYVSIPHLAWTFHSWDTGASDTPFTLAIGPFTLLSTTSQWFNSYLEAMSIDVIIALLSITLTNSKHRQQTGIGYTFISLLIAISWLFNWIYAKEHAPLQTGIWTHHIGIISIDTITPIITSALPVFALAFTIMIDKLTGEKITAAQLQELANELELINTQKARLKELKKGRVTGATTEAIDSVAGVANHLFSKLPKRAKKNNQTPEPEGKKEETPEETERNTDELQVVNGEETPEETTEESREENIPSWLATGGSTISIDTVIKHTQLTRKKLNHRVETKQIRATKNKGIVYKDSLIQWMKAEGILLETGKIAHLTLLGNDEENTEEMPEQEIGMLPEREEITVG